jgi:ubiquinone/menaquinone biosynthesis C-methylase UbiE
MGADHCETTNADVEFFILTVMQMDEMIIKQKNEQYWSNLAFEYDGKYENAWSDLENDFIRNEIKALIRTNDRVLDLGCGTGLGYAMCSDLTSSMHYTGIDISSQMIAVFKGRHADANVLVGDMEDLGKLGSGSFDLAISTFSAFSFSHDAVRTIAEVYRVLDNGGSFLIGGLSRFSLGRILSFKFAARERYSTRGSDIDDFTYANFFSPGQLRSLFEKEGFKEVNVIGYNAFGGLDRFEKNTAYWKLNRMISRIFPFLSHELVITGKK